MGEIGEALQQGMKENHGGSGEWGATMRKDWPWKLWEREIERKRERVSLWDERKRKSQSDGSNEGREKKRTKHDLPNYNKHVYLDGYYIKCVYLHIYTPTNVGSF